MLLNDTGCYNTEITFKIYIIQCFVFLIDLVKAEGIVFVLILKGSECV